MAPWPVLLRARQKRPSPMIPAASTRTTMTATILCCLIPVRMYSALEAGYVFGVPPSGGKVWGPDAIPPEGGTPNFCRGGRVVTNSVAFVLGLRSFFFDATV